MHRFFPGVRTAENLLCTCPINDFIFTKDDLRFLHYHENVNIAGCEYIYSETLFDQKLECVAKDPWINNFADRLSGHGPLES